MMSLPSNAARSQVNQGKPTEATTSARKKKQTKRQKKKKTFSFVEVVHAGTRQKEIKKQKVMEKKKSTQRKITGVIQ